MTEYEARRIEHEQMERLISVLGSCGDGLDRIAAAFEKIAHAFDGGLTVHAMNYKGE